MKEEVVIVLDCGATNIRAVAVNRNGKILGKQSHPNHFTSDPYFEGGLIWDTEHIYQKLSEACKQLCTELNECKIIGVCTCSFGVDGTLFDKNGKQLYPVISWACERTKSIVEEAHKIMPLTELHKITGLNYFHFNTLYKLYWLQKFHKDIIDKAEHWLFMPAILSGYLCNARFTDVSMLGTSMLCERLGRRLSKEILDAFGLREDMFPGLKEAGEKVGEVSKTASATTGIPAGVPVFAAGHDTQFAIYGSRAGVNKPVLSSGTWEILMVRTPEVNTGKETMRGGITTELDAEKGLYNPGLQWLGSGHIEEIRRDHFGDIAEQEDVYDIMIAEAEAETDRGMIFKTMLKKLSEKTRGSLKLLEKSCGFQTEKLLVVGGGSKNALWNRIREEILGIEVTPIPQVETTVIGAAKVVFDKISEIDN